MNVFEQRALFLFYGRYDILTGFSRYYRARGCGVSVGRGYLQKRNGGTTHPPKNAVAAPVNKQEKAADVDRKVLSLMYLSLTLLLTLLPPLASILWCHSGFPSRTLSLQRPIAQGESSSVYSACATPTIPSQFRPPTPTLPASEIIPEEDDEEHEGLVQSKRGLVVIKRVPLLRGRAEKLVDILRELELARGYAMRTCSDGAAIR